MEVHENERGWFLFMQMDLDLLRLDIGRLLPGPARQAKTRPEFQVVNKYRFPDGNTTVPKDLAYTAVSGHLYMLGGNWFEGSNWNGKSTEKQKKQWGNLEVYECELEVGDNPEMDPVLICKTSDIPNMWGHKINPIVINLDRKIYVLARTFAGVVEEHWPPLFEVFDPDTRSWKVLPNIPSIGGPLNATFIYKHFSWGNKIVVTSWSRDPATSALYFYAFDTIQEKWEDASAIGVGGFPNFPVSDFACYNSFLIAKRSLKSEVVAYELNSNGIPVEVRVLDELQGIFYPRFEAVWHSLVTHLGDGLMCLVYHGLGPNVSQDDDTDGEDGALDTDGEDGALGRQESAGPVLSVRVVLFRLSISENVVLSANVETVETYEFKHLKCPRMCPPFIK